MWVSYKEGQLNNTCESCWGGEECSDLYVINISIVGLLGIGDYFRGPKVG
jgi:hypothetical protein